MVEIFKIQYKPKVYINLDDTQTLPTTLGVFEKMYQFDENLKRTQEDALHEWLSYSCSKNFIFIKCTNHLIGGGLYDSTTSFKNRKKYYRDSDVTQYYVKLYHPDTTAFEMVWLTDFITQL